MIKYSNDSAIINDLTAAEVELLSHAAEEAAEVIAIIGKILRHGKSSKNPYNDEPCNSVLLSQELGNLIFLKNLLEAKSIVSSEELIKGFINKANKFNKYSHNVKIIENFWDKM